jgi:hypothetical protein
MKSGINYPPTSSKKNITFGDIRWAGWKVWGGSIEKRAKPLFEAKKGMISIQFQSTRFDTDFLSRLVNRHPLFFGADCSSVQREDGSLLAS